MTPKPAKKRPLKLLYAASAAALLVAGFSYFSGPGTGQDQAAQNPIYNSVSTKAEPGPKFDPAKELVLEAAGNPETQLNFEKKLTDRKSVV